ncbi:MAG: response regulator [Flammeovirgaceae bacterium]|nr:response regulator [Flammeovirgaceae bacterium]
MKSLNQKIIRLADRVPRELLENSWGLFVILLASVVMILLNGCTNSSNTITPTTKPLIEDVYASGFIKSKDEYQLFSQAEGYLNQKLVNDGDQVKKEILFLLSHSIWHVHTGSISKLGVLRFVNLYLNNKYPLVAKDLQSMVKKVEPAAEIIETIGSVEKAKQWFAKNIHPEMILSDIQLSDGTSFEIFESLHIQCPVIFTTAYNEFAIRAFKLNSIDYLLKPIDRLELEKAIQKYKSLISGGILSEQLKNLAGQFSSTPKKFKERFLSQHRNTLIPIVDKDIAYFHKEELIFLHTVNHEKYISDHQLWMNLNLC